MLAWYFQRHESRIACAISGRGRVDCAVPVWLIKRQPDLGIALMIGASGFYVLFLAGLSWKVIVGLVAGAGAAAPLIWPHLREYQKERILTFIDPSRDPLGAGYHSTQASIALGSGGAVGKGWLNGTQTHLDFLPERHTDFIFAVFGEEFGLIGNVVLLILYIPLIGRALVITMNVDAVHASRVGRDHLMFFTYAFVNMAMVSGLRPSLASRCRRVVPAARRSSSLFIGLGILA
jgi:rod shape determining protein RodA